MKDASEKSMHFLAKQAKDRMTSGYYGIASRRERDGRSVKQSFQDKLLYEKIVQIIQSGLDLPDVIGRLADKKIMQSPDAAVRQRHILQTAANYIKVKREYEKRSLTM